VFCQVLLAWLAATGPAWAIPLFVQDTPLEVRLTGPLQATQDDLEHRRERAFLIEVDGARHDIEVRVRGNSRTRVCHFPPLRLDFPRRDMDGTVFEGVDKIKLVTHCRGGHDAAMDVLEEFAAYRLFSALTDQSYRTRLVRMHYTDSDGERNTGPAVSHAFLIEPDDVLAARLGWAEARRASVRRGDFEPVHVALVYLFQYMIGNTDWSLVTAENDEHCCHNGRLFEGSGRLYYLPYDFDLAGLVDTRYAKPDPGLRIRNVRQRLYRGYCVEDGALSKAMQIVLARREAVMSTVAAIPALDERARRRMSDYLADFYAEAGDGSALTRDFHDRCL